MATKQEKLARFFTSDVYAVVGASANKDKFGYKVFHCYQAKGYQVIPVHPALAELDDIACVASVSDLPDTVTSISVITPPQVTEKVVREAAAKGIRNIWMQPGAQSDAAVSFCEEHGISVIADGTCLLVELGCPPH